LKDIKKKTVRGIAWIFLQRAGSQGIGFMITIFLARLISPAEFGLVAMAAVFIAITRIFIDAGLKDSLIQKEKCTQTDYSTVFFFNMAVSVGLFILIFFSAPWIAQFFGYPELTPIIRVLGLKPFFYSFSIIQTAIIHKELLFSKLAKIHIPAVVVSGVAGLVFAWYGYGVLALVIQTILETFLYNVMLWLISPWRPHLIFDKEIFRFHWKHGSRLLIIGAIGAVYRNIFSLIIGKFFSPAQVGFYSRADSFKTIAYNNTVGLVETVSYPVLAKVQNDHALLKRTYRKILQSTMFVLLPLVAVIITNAAGIIEFLLTSKWLPAAPILIVLMLALTLSPFNSINLNILRVKRRTDLMLRVDIVNKLLVVILLLVTVKLGFDYLVMTNLIMAVVALFINNFYTNKLIGYSIKDQLTDMWSIILAFLVSVGITTLFKKLALFDLLIIDLIITALVSLTAYLLVIFVLKKEIIFSQVETLKLLKSRKSSDNDNLNLS